MKNGLVLMPTVLVLVLGLLESGQVNQAKKVLVIFMA